MNWKRCIPWIPIALTAWFVVFGGNARLNALGLGIAWACERVVAEIYRQGMELEGERGDLLEVDLRDARDTIRSLRAWLTNPPRDRGEVPVWLLVVVLALLLIAGITGHIPLTDPVDTP